VGASGYIGLAVAVALRNDGFKVVGTVRSAEASKKLVDNEVTPILCEQQQTDKWLQAAVESDIVIDAIGYNEHSDGTLANWLASCNTREAQKKPKSLFILTSGIMTYGVAGQNRILDENVVPEPIEGHAHGLPRKLFEDKVLASHGVVIRPGWVYGFSGGSYNAFFFNQIDASNNTVTTRGRPDKMYSWVHISDLAEAYVLLCRQDRAKVDGQLFNISARDYPSYEEIILAGAKVAGLSNPKIVRQEIPSGDSARYLEANVRVDPKKAEQVFGWKARHVGFLQEMELYYPAWKNAQKKQ